MVLTQHLLQTADILNFQKFLSEGEHFCERDGESRFGDLRLLSQRHCGAESFEGPGCRQSLLEEELRIDPEHNCTENRYT